MGFELHVEGEPRGKPYGEPREDNLFLDTDQGCWRNEDDARVCGAFIRNRDWKWRRCKRKITMENGRCRDHGGATPSGQDHGAFKHGKYSKDLPANIKSRYEEVREDETLTNLREEVALIETRVHEVLSALDAKDSAELWQDIEREFHQFRSAHQAGDQQEASKHLRAVTGLIEEGASQQSKWREIGELVERKRKLVESERKREKALQAYVPLERFSILITAIDEIIRRNVNDDEVMRDIAREIKQTISLG
jgi:hypothetical protein